MKRIALTAAALALTGCSVLNGTVTIDGELKPEEVQAVSRDLTQAVAIGTIANGAPIFRDSSGKGSAICDMLANSANSDSVLVLLATNGLCDVFTLATGQFPTVAKPE